MVDLKKVQQRLMLTQSEFAKALGVTTSTLWRWQNGVGKPNKIYMQYLQALDKKSRTKMQMRPETIRAIRKSNGLTQEEFAKAIGTNVVTLADWERGRHRPREAMQKKIYEFYLKHRGD